MPELSLDAVDDPAAWDALVARSPQGTLFSESRFLQAAGCAHRLFWIRQGRAVKAGLALTVSPDGRQVVADDLVIHGGLLFDPAEVRHPVKCRRDEFLVTEFVVTELLRRFDRIELPLAPQVDDLRPFLWHGYHGPKAEQFRLDLRYTSYLDISPLHQAGAADTDANLFFQNMETVRRHRVREAAKKGARVELGRCAEPLLAHYTALMSAQGDCPAPAKIDAMRRVIQRLMADDRGALFHVHDADGTLLYCVFYGWDDKRAYYLYGAGDPQRNTPWQGTLAHWFAFGHLARERGVVEVDLEGINSPQRGWFKLGFGGNLQPYHTLHWGPAA